MSMTDKEKLAYTMGKAFAIGFVMALHRRGLSYDANTNNPNWVTLSNGLKVEIGPSGIITKGRFKGVNIKHVREVAGTKKNNVLNPRVTAYELKNIYFRHEDEIKDVKEESAIYKLNKIKKGYVENAFKRDDIGGISLSYGDNYAGLKHIEIRNHVGVNKAQFTKVLSDTIRLGNLYKDVRQGREGNHYLIKEIDPKNSMIVVLASTKGSASGKQFVVTAYKAETRGIKKKYKPV